MRLSPDRLEICVFLYRNRLEHGRDGVRQIKKPVGTGFLVGVPLGPLETILYVVTARHGITADFQEPLWIRINTKDGKSRFLQTDPEEWHLHKTADVAAYRLVRDNDFAARYVSIDSFVGPGPDYGMSIIRDANGLEMRDSVQAGDPVAVIGLLIQEHGDEANLPVARFGHISRMPSMVHVPLSGVPDFKGIAYLMECLSWSGLSGSPVLWMHEYDVSEKVADGLDKIYVRFRPFLLGCVVGQWAISKRSTPGATWMAKSGLTLIPGSRSLPHRAQSANC